jgi:hypothetical protein
VTIGVLFVILVLIAFLKARERFQDYDD